MQSLVENVYGVKCVHFYENQIKSNREDAEQADFSSSKLRLILDRRKLNMRRF